MNVLQDSLLELIRRTSAEIPEDVHKAIVGSLEREKKGTIAESAMKIIEKNIELAKNKSQPICQDTGSILFYVDCPVGFDQLAFRHTAREAVKLATKKGYLRQNSVDSITGRNDGTNVGPGSPTAHFHQHRSEEVRVRLVLKGGGCENVGAQYSLPSEKLEANRDLEGCRKVILDAVLQAQGKGCGPGILGVCIGGDRATGYEHSRSEEHTSELQSLAYLVCRLLLEKKKEYTTTNARTLAPSMTASRRAVLIGRTVASSL